MVGHVWSCGSTGIFADFQAWPNLCPIKTILIHNWNPKNRSRAKHLQSSMLWTFWFWNPLCWINHCWSKSHRYYICQQQFSFWIFSLNCFWAGYPQIREQTSGPDFHVFTPKFLAPQKNYFFPHKKYFPKFFWLLFTFILCNFSLQTLKYFQKNFKLFFCT